LIVLLNGGGSAAGMRHAVATVQHDDGQVPSSHASSSEIFIATGVLGADMSATSPPPWPRGPLLLWLLPATMNDDSPGS